jgi:hypothetical protein
MKDKTIQLYVTSEEHKRIRRFCFDREISMTSLFTKLMLEYIDREEINANKSANTHTGTKRSPR